MEVVGLGVVHRHQEHRLGPRLGGQLQEQEGVHQQRQDNNVLKTTNIVLKTTYKFVDVDLLLRGSEGLQRGDQPQQLPAANQRSHDQLSANHSSPAVQLLRRP